MNTNKRRSFRPRPQKNSFRRRGPSSNHSQGGHFHSNGNGNFNRNGSMSNPFNVEKTIQKFQQLAKDSQSSGDPVLVENYLQHADHYIRKLSEMNSRVKSTPIEQNEITENKENENKVVEKISSSEKNLLTEDLKNSTE